MRLTNDEYQSDLSKMKAFIARLLPQEGTRIVIADGQDGEFWVELDPVRYDDGVWDLHWETNCLEAFDLREIYEDFRRQEMTVWERRRSFPVTPASGRHRPKLQAQSSPPAVGVTSGLLRLGHCVSLAGHSESSLRRAIKDGRLKAHSIGRGRKRPTYGICRADLEAFIVASRVQPPDPLRIPTIGVKKKSRHFD